MPYRSPTFDRMYRPRRYRAAADALSRPVALRLRTAGDEHELQVRSVRRPTDFRFVEAGDAQRDVDLVAIAEPQRRVGGQHRAFIAELEGRPERHEREFDGRDLLPAGHAADAGHGHLAVGRLAVPTAPCECCRISRLEDEPAAWAQHRKGGVECLAPLVVGEEHLRDVACHRYGVDRAGTSSGGIRSEEHTSELQSHVNLVCRLLLEKKKKT